MPRKLDDDPYEVQLRYVKHRTKEVAYKYYRMLGAHRSKSNVAKLHIAELALVNRVYPSRFESGAIYGLGGDALIKLLRVYLHIAVTGELPAHADRADPEEWPLDELERIEQELAQLMEKAHGAAVEIRERGSIPNVERPRDG